MIVEATAHYANRSTGDSHLIYPLRAALLASQTWCDSVETGSDVFLRFVTTTETESQEALIATRPTSVSHRQLSETTEEDLGDSLADPSSLWINFDSRWSLSPVCGPPYGDPVPLRLLGIGPAAFEVHGELAWLQFASRVAHALRAADHLSNLNDTWEELFAYRCHDGSPTDGFEEGDQHFRRMLGAFDDAVQPLVRDIRTLVGMDLPYWSIEEFYR